MSYPQTTRSQGGACRTRTIGTKTVWIVHLTLGLAALYAAVITAMYFAQTWLLFPTAPAAAGDVELPALTQRLELWSSRFPTAKS